ncbi:dTDP-4-dehydrorhamnose 3,5-epimerase [Methanocaldococcus sp.]|uniref:dTDP-4-dehydrorhamnose 3,5-epimerase n=1 Tax=Methanocaldococcus sp. TaxID=2152917 RepID=UPI0026165D01|nr:dTDP-4-dehydrorhamnose 3,5-epimerase [Methanocaldococcus sp.]MCQ6254061.1 dTDP-4-dehydrorhamnose 3,5-epimerase [Methanocaldococcus sp.]
MPFKFRRLEIPEVILIEPIVFEDERGFFMETYKYSEFSKFGIKEIFVQDNHSKSKKGVLRGLHYQKNPNAQGKLVRCIRGEIFDVAVDIRKGSPTFGKWVGVILSEENKKMLYIPKGFAHGFCVLSEEAEVIYKCTAEYSPEDDRGIIWNDKDIGIDWPIKNPILSEKDKKHPPLREADINFVYEKNNKVRL